jgi:hypothetical protein
MAAVDVMAQNGILRPAEVIELAARAKLDLACACVLLIKESGGGKNVWGSDPVQTGGAYTKGSAVTQANYRAYRDAVKLGIAGRQGVGPTQLTYGPFQDQADAAGGCWEWRANVVTGFSILAGLIRVAGEQDGFRRYNGSGPAADKYGIDAVSKLRVWRQKLTGQSLVLPEVDMPLNDDDKRWILQAIQANNGSVAEAVWASTVTNYWNDRVQAVQILSGVEARVADVQNQVHEHLPISVVQTQGVAAGVDLNALADAVVDRLAARLGGV